jgi:hypothetical protein
LTAEIFRGQLVFAYLPAALLVGTFVLPWLRGMEHVRAQRIIATFHSFRYVGLIFIVPGVVGSSIPPAFAAPAAFGDLATSVLAIMTLLTVRFHRVFWSFAVAFNLVGLYDLTSAYVHGNASGLAPAAGQLGAAYFIPILYVPLLMLTHLVALYLMIEALQRRSQRAAAAATAGAVSGASMKASKNAASSS